MLQRLNPATVPAPFSRYSHAVTVPQGYEWLYVSGQVGCDLERKIPDSFEAQAELTWRNVIEVVKAAGYTVHDLVKVTTLLTRASDVPASRQVRDRMLGAGVEPASTLMVVAGLAVPQLLIEVEAVAARAVKGAA